MRTPVPASRLPAPPDTAPARTLARRGPARTARKPRVPRPPAASDDDSSVPPKPALLGSIGFWQRPRTAEAAERTHLAAVFAFVADDAGGRRRPRCDRTRADRGLARRAAACGVLPRFQAVMALVGGGLLVLCAMAMAWGGALSGTMLGVRLRRGLATWLMVAAIVAFAAWLVWAFFIDSARRSSRPNAEAANGLSGMVVAPTVIAAVGALIATASMSWGYGRPIQLSLRCAHHRGAGLRDRRDLAVPSDPDATMWMTWTAASLVAGRGRVPRTCHWSRRRTACAHVTRAGAATARLSRCSWHGSRRW